MLDHCVETTGKACGVAECSTCSRVNRHSGYFLLILVGSLRPSAPASVQMITYEFKL
jgi:hypothetical protein